MEDNEKVTYIGETDSRNRRLRFGIKKIDRSKHMYAIGKTGMGKSTLLENMAIQDIQNGDGVCFIDPHGKSADLLLEYVPKERIKDVIYFAPFDMDYPISFNVMEDVGPEKRYLVASGMMAAFKKIWVDAWSARMEYILGNIMLALLEYPGSTLVGVNRMLTDKDFRKEVVSHISDPSVKSFWVNEYANYTDKFAAEAAPAIQNKVGQFVANPLIRNIIGQAKSSFDIRDVMDNKKILIINLSKGRVGEANANLLGSMLITKIYLGAMSRADLNEKQLAQAPNFYLYVDEFQSFANESFADILSEARKYKLNLCIAHQYIEQMTEEVRAAVFGNVGTMCIFRVGAYDAEILEKEFAPVFTAEDIVGLQKYQMYLKLMIDGVTSNPFSASGLNPIPKPEVSYVQEILDSSRALYARPRQETEEELLKWIQTNFAKSGGSSQQQSKVPQQQSSQPRPVQQSNPSSQPRPQQPQVNNAPRSPQQQPPRPQQQPQTVQRPLAPLHTARRPEFDVKTATSSIQPQKNNERENELRNAMSLSYLKPEQEKKDTKVQKPENIAALREALLAVMGTGAASEIIKEEVSNTPQQVVHEKKEENIQTVEYPQIKKHNPSFSTKPETLSEKVEKKAESHNVKHEPVMNTSQSPVHEKTDSTTEKVKKAEVAEELLQQIFDVE